jgi:hypothetical protein
LFDSGAKYQEGFAGVSDGLTFCLFPISKYAKRPFSADGLWSAASPEWHSHLTYLLCFKRVISGGESPS